MQNRRRNPGQLIVIDRKAIIDFGIRNKYIELEAGEENSDQIIINKFVTTLLYETQRHGFEAPQCKEMRKHIEALEPKLRNQPLNEYEKYIYQQEKDNNTFYGSFLSEDSDSESEEIFKKKSENEKMKLTNTAKLFQQRGQMDSLFMKSTTKNNKAGELKVHMKNASQIFDLSERTIIHYDDEVNQVKMKRDLNYLNYLINNKHYTLEEALEEISKEAKKRKEEFTNFYIAEYRGITYHTNKWNKPSRMAHRADQGEIGKRQYSASVYKTVGVSLFHNYNETRQLQQNQPQLFDNPAEELREILLTFREPKPYTYDRYSYSSLAYLLQNVYSENYYEFHQLIKKDKDLAAILPNDVNPFFSMGDIPYHACKYAYGIKPYAGHENERLRPRWRHNGRAERPYSGAIYLSLHPITDFTSNGPLHLVTLNRAAEIQCKSELNILAERESCFPAYLQENRIFHKHVAKYPSFRDEDDYKKIYQMKYGLSKPLYNKFKSGFANSKPHSDENRALKRLLGEWLCSFHEVKFIDLARQEAEKRNGVLIYRDIDGGFSLVPPVDSVNRNSNRITQEIKSPIKEKQGIRRSFSDHKKNIQSVIDEKSVSKIIDNIEMGYDSDKESASVNHEGNHGISLPLSLMLNAVLNKRYRALKRFVQISEFAAAVNEPFNSDGFSKMTLLHLAAAMDDISTIKILTELPNCDLNAKAEESIEIMKNNTTYYEDITPFHLAIMRNCNQAALYFLEHKQDKLELQCSRVLNKDLLKGDMLSYPSEKDDPDYLGLALSCREGYTICRERNISMLELSRDHKNNFFIEKFGSEKLADKESVAVNSHRSLTISM